MPRHCVDEVEMAAHRPRHVPNASEVVDLFMPLEVHPKRAPAGGAEQTDIPIEGTLQARYDAWRATEQGRLVYVECRDLALRQASEGAKRIAVKGIVELVRATLKVQVNNSATALLARELYDREPVLRPLIELRERTRP
jgi:hypothetical protein